MAQAGFTVLFALVVNVYRHKGYWTKLMSSYTARMFVLDAIVFLDTTDLLHYLSYPDTLDEASIK